MKKRIKSFLSALRDALLNIPEEPRIKGWKPVQKIPLATASYCAECDAIFEGPPACGHHTIPLHVMFSQTSRAYLSPNEGKAAWEAFLHRYDIGDHLEQPPPRPPQTMRG